MYRILSFIVIASFVSILLYFHQQNSHFENKTQAGHMEHHEGLEISKMKDAKIPEIDGWIKQDQTGSWMVKIITNNFAFKPEKLGLEEQQINEGHAHLYINGDKKNRIYGHYHDLGTLKPGIYDVMVTLNTHNHKVLFYQGKEVAFRYKLKVK